MANNVAAKPRMPITRATTSMDSALLSALVGLIPFAGFPAPVIGSEGHSPSAEGQPPTVLLAAPGDSIAVLLSFHKNI